MQDAGLGGRGPDAQQQQVGQRLAQLRRGHSTASRSLSRAPWRARALPPPPRPSEPSSLPSRRCTAPIAQAAKTIEDANDRGRKHDAPLGQPEGRPRGSTAAMWRRDVAQEEAAPGSRARRSSTSTTQPAGA
jgi:hypothetical protein